MLETLELFEMFKPFLIMLQASPAYGGTIKLQTSSDLNFFYHTTKL